MTKDWQKHASKVLGRAVQKTPDGKGLMLTMDELEQITQITKQRSYGYLWAVSIGFLIAAIMVLVKG